jgi:hypothetical protein
MASVASVPGHGGSQCPAGGNRFKMAQGAPNDGMQRTSLRAAADAER